MRVYVIEDESSETAYTLFSYDTQKEANCVFPAERERPQVVAALTEALGFAAGPRPFLERA
jgi:hypothetical protein